MSASESRIYLLRHGEPQLESGGRRYIGQGGLPLSPAGVRQAEQWRDYFGGIAIDSIFSSDLQRAAHTAQIVAQGHGLEVLLMPDLREVNLGAWEGLTFEAVRRRDPAGFERRGRDLEGYRPPGGESFGDLRSRVVPAFERIIAQATANILIVGHAGVNRVILCHLLGMPLAHLFRLGQDYAGLNIIEPHAAECRVLAINSKVC